MASFMASMASTASMTESYDCSAYSQNEEKGVEAQQLSTGEIGSCGEDSSFGSDEESPSRSVSESTMVQMMPGSGNASQSVTLSSSNAPPKYERGASWPCAINALHSEDEDEFFGLGGAVGDIDGEFRMEDRRTPRTRGRRRTPRSKSSQKLPKWATIDADADANASSCKKDRLDVPTEVICLPPRTITCKRPYDGRDDQEADLRQKFLERRLVQMKASSLMLGVVLLLCLTYEFPALVAIANQNQVMFMTSPAVQPTQSTHTTQLSDQGNAVIRDDVPGRGRQITDKHRAERQIRQQASAFISRKSAPAIPPSKTTKQALQVKRGQTHTRTSRSNTAANAASNAPREQKQKQTPKAQSSVLAPNREDHREPHPREDGLLTQSLKKSMETQAVRSYKRQVSALYSNMADLTSIHDKADTPVFWHVPMSGSLFFKEVLGYCLGLTVACEAGHEFVGNSREVEVFEKRGIHFVNVDTMSKKGLNEAAKLGLAKSSVSDVVVVSHLMEANDVFSTSIKGRMFAVFRHPVERAMARMCALEGGLAAAVSHVRHASDEGGARHIPAPLKEDNWMTRFLTNDQKNPLEMHHLKLAKEVLARKFLVGIHGEFEESLQRFQTYFGWKNRHRAVPNMHKQHQSPSHRHLEQRDVCAKKMLQSKGLDASAGRCSSLNPEEMDKEERIVYDRLKEQNEFDIQLFEYARELFEFQGKLFAKAQQTSAV